MSKVLVVEDEASVREVIVNYLNGADIVCDAVGTAKEALTRMEADRYDMVLTDIVMPGMNGLELTRKIVKKYTTVPVVIITAYGTFDHAVEAIDSGAFNFISKPFSKKQIIKIVEKGLRLPRYKAGKMMLIPYMKQEIDFELPTNLELVEAVSHQICRAAESTGFSRKASSLSIPLSIDEMLVNAMEHGNRLDGKKRVFVKAKFDEKGFHLWIRDEGEGFDQENIRDAFDPEDIFSERGRGILLVKHYMSDVQYNDKGNEVYLCYARSKDDN